MQEKIDRFNAAFVNMAADYVERLRLKIVQASVITVAEKRAGTDRIDEPDWKIQLPDQVRIADCLAVSVGRIEDRMERRRNADADKQPKEAADKLGFLRDFLEGKTRWNFPEGTVFNVNTSTGDGAAVQLKPEAKRGAEQTAEREAQPGFICFSSAATENGEDPEKAPSVSVIMRVERMDVDEKTLLCLKRIQQKAAAEVNALLGW